MESKDIQTFCRIDNAGEELLKMAITKHGLSARAYDRILNLKMLFYHKDTKALFVSSCLRGYSFARNELNSTTLFMIRSVRLVCLSLHLSVFMVVSATFFIVHILKTTTTRS